jgi:hypothetical protein
MLIRSIWAVGVVLGHPLSSMAWDGPSGVVLPPLLGKAWVVTYALVFLAIALGLMVVCRPPARQKQARRRPRR